MNHVTRGLGRTSGLLATGGLGRRILFPIITDVVGQIVDVTGRVWSVAVARSWSVELHRDYVTAVMHDRIRAVLATTRTSINSVTRQATVWLKRVFGVNGEE